MTRDSAGLEILNRSECLTLLGSTPVGRIGYTHHALPAIQPVNFIVDGNAVVIRTGVGSKLAAATRQSVVAFEADAFDPETRSGWSVMVIGRSAVVTAEQETARLAGLLSAWAPRARDHFVRITIDEISGRKLVARPSDRGHPLGHGAASLAEPGVESTAQP